MLCIIFFACFSRQYNTLKFSNVAYSQNSTKSSGEKYIIIKIKKRKIWLMIGAANGKVLRQSSGNHIYITREGALLCLIMPANL